MKKLARLMVPLVFTIGCSMIGCAVKKGTQYGSIDRFFNWLDGKPSFEEVATAKKTRRESYLTANPKMPDVFKDAIMKGGIMIGMTHEDVTASWGAPYDKRQFMISGELGETWEYGLSDGIANRLIYFRNGLVYGWNN